MAGTIAVFVTGWIAHQYLIALPVAVACLVAGVVGGIDDFRSLTARTRLLLQLVIGGLVAFGTAGVSTHIDDYLVAGMVTLIVVAYVNAFNFMDGINGISAVSGAITAAWLATVAIAESQWAVAWLAAGLAGTCIGFLPWNFPVARIFLGDAGSYFLGVTLAALAATLWVAGASPVLCAAPFLPYLFDTGFTLILRAKRGEPLTQAHREHLYQRLARRTGHVTSTSVVAAVTAGCVGAGLVLNKDGWLLGSVIVASALAIYWKVSMSGVVSG
jgi:UDP-N-acetylmuramyl pentapeptide phosphotransferase/UDP-N-acetylglucosamine-1-phosphate transferase